MAMSIRERNEIVLSNLGLIKKIASKYSKRTDDWDDSYQSGIEKFLKIIDSYDCSKGSLSTYVWPHIQNCIMENNATVPVSLRKKINRFENIRDYLEKKSCSKVTDSDLAEYFGISKVRLNQYYSQANVCKTVSLTPVYSSDNDSELDLLNIKLYDFSNTPEEIVIKSEESDILKNAWNCLDGEERTILAYRTTYGTDLEKPLSLRQIEKIMGISRTTIGNKEKKAAEHLKRILENQKFCS